MKVMLIVEGLKDAEQIHNAFDGNEDVNTFVTGGTKFNSKIVRELQRCLDGGDCTIYILSDPDSAGDVIASKIQSVFPEIERLEADKGECSYFTGNRYKMGVEYSSYNYLRKLISPIIGVEYIEEENINWE